MGEVRQTAAGLATTVRIIYIGNASDSVYDTQSRRLVIELKKKGLNVEHFEGLTMRDFFLPGTLIDNLKNKRFPILPVYPGLIFVQFLFIAASVFRISGFSKTVFHIRSDVLASIFVRSAWILGIGEEQIVIDVRGATYREFVDYRFKQGRLLSQARKFCLKRLRCNLRGRNCKFTAVSLALSKYVAETYSVECEVVPCISPFKWTPPPSMKAKKLARKELGLPIESPIVVAVDGGGSPWQLAIKDIETIASETLLVLNLSKQVSMSPFVLTRYLLGEDYEKALVASDAALMIRNASIVNRVAVPIKYLEYSCKSLPIIANRSVDSVVNYLRHTRQGVIIDALAEINTDLVSSLITFRDSAAKLHRCSKWLRSHELSRVEEKYVGIYASIASNNLPA